MYDPKFEKAVQQKMEELEFRPADLRGLAEQLLIKRALWGIGGSHDVGNLARHNGA